MEVTLKHCSAFRFFKNNVLSPRVLSEIWQAIFVLKFRVFWCFVDAFADTVFCAQIMVWGCVRNFGKCLISDN